MTITMLTVLVFVMVLDVFQTVNQGLRLSQERLGTDAILISKYASADGSDLLFTAIPENIYMSIEVVEQAAELEGVAAVVFGTSLINLISGKEGQVPGILIEKQRRWFPIGAVPLS